MVRETLSKVDNVDTIKVDLATKTATVTMKKGKLTKEAVDAAFEGGRYSLSSFKAVPIPLPKTYRLTISGMT